VLLARVGRGGGGAGFTGGRAGGGFASRACSSFLASEKDYLTSAMDGGG
jgi:hypothetical protein